jgi:hypothetical protein
MRRSTLLALFLIVALSSSLVACGGGGDDDTTPTGAAAKVTSTSSATGTAAVATGASGVTPSAASGGSGPGSGASGTSVVPGSTPTGGTSGATPTRHPATVVSTPRPIATKPPAPTEAPATEETEPTATEGQAGETATSEDGQLTIVLDDTFDDPEASYFETGTSEFNTQLAIVDGVYSIIPDLDSWQTITVGPDDSWDFADGLITADVAMTGAGEFGLVSRQYQDDNGDFYFYVCWLTTAGDAGCTTYAPGDDGESTFQTALFSTSDPSLVQTTNNLLLQVIGTETRSAPSTIRRSPTATGASTSTGAKPARNSPSTR